MKTIFDRPTREQLIDRIDSLDESMTPQWGEMNIYQMLKHCTLAEEMYLGKKKYKRMFLGCLLGKMMLKRMLKDDSPMGRNAPTSRYFKVSESKGDVTSEKKKWIALLQEYEQYSNRDLVHWFFGEMTKEQVGQFVYKHTDHHLRQFNV